jgi:alpha-ketoglutarate-dependent taurine dioxygenase
MDDIIFSPLLKEIFERAALVGGNEDPFGEFVTPAKVPQPVTAERFLIAAIERSHTYYGLESERSLLRRMLERKIRDLDKAKQALLDYINHHDATREDELRFAAITDSAAYPGSDGKKTLVSFALALKILREPPKAVQPFL